MKTEKNILVAFLLNIFFAIIEFIGGLFINSIAIVSDAIHDMGDAISILISYILEKVSKKKPDDKYTYGYIRYSIIGSIITTIILIVGSIFVIYSSIVRIFNPIDINYDGMLIFAIFGVIINFIAALYTKEGDSLNQKSVNLHMLEDVLGWVVVLIGSIIMKFTNIRIIDSIMSIGVSLFILINAFKNLMQIVDLFLEKTPKGISISELKKHILKIDGVLDVHHIHVWSIDGFNNYATMHVVANNNKNLKKEIKEELMEHGISHVTIEFEDDFDDCDNKTCKLKKVENHHHHHH